MHAIPDPLDRGLHLAREINLGVFFVGRNKKPVRSVAEGGHGFYDGTNDPDELRALWEAYGGAYPAVRTDRPADEIGCLDIDTEDETGRPVGMESLIEAGHHHDFKSTIFHATPHEGEHHIYRVPGPAPAPKAILTKVDRKTGGSYFVW